MLESGPEANAGRRDGFGPGAGLAPEAEAARVANQRAAERLARRQWSVDALSSLALAVTLLVLAEVIVGARWVSPLLVPQPSDVFGAIWDGLVERGTYWPHLRSTVSAAGLGFLISSSLAVVVAALLSLSRRVERIIYPFIVSFQTLPKVALAPLVLLWFGFGARAKLMVVIIVVFFPMFVSTLQGLRVREQERYDLMKSLGASKLEQLTHLRIPAAVPYIFGGLHIGVVFSLIGAVVAEFVGSNEGLGYVLLLEKAAFNVPGVFAILALLMALGTSLHFVMKFIERRVAFWAQDVTLHAT